MRFRCEKVVCIGRSHSITNSQRTLDEMYVYTKGQPQPMMVMIHVDSFFFREYTGELCIIYIKKKLDINCAYKIQPPKPSLGLDKVKDYTSTRTT